VAAPKGGVVKKLKKSWKLLILFGLVLIMTLGYVVRSRAFTLIELKLDYMGPYVFSSANFGHVKVTNISDVNLSVSAEVFTDGGTVFQQFAAVTATPGQTVTFGITKVATGTMSLRPVVEISGGHNLNSAITELLVFNGNNQIIELLPAVQLGY
jgi:hypothetical protein